MCAVIGVYALAHWVSIFAHRWNVYRSRVWLRIVAPIRYLSSKLFYIKPLDWCSPSLGVMILGAVGLIFFFCKYTIYPPTQLSIALVTNVSSPSTGTKALLLARRPQQPFRRFSPFGIQISFHCSGHSSFHTVGALTHII
jgi:hypothetical protein